MKEFIEMTIVYLLMVLMVIATLMIFGLVVAIPIKVVWFILMY